MLILSTDLLSLLGFIEQQDDENEDDTTLSQIYPTTVVPPETSLDVSVINHFPTFKTETGATLSSIISTEFSDPTRPESLDGYRGQDVIVKIIVETINYIIPFMIVRLSSKQIEVCKLFPLNKENRLIAQARLCP